MEKIEGELRVQDGMDDITERISHGLHAPAILGGVALLHGVELMVEEDGARGSLLARKKPSTGT